MSPTGGEQRFGVRFTQKGVQELLSSVDQLASRIRVAGVEVKKTTRNTHELGRSFRNIALRTVAYLGIVRGFNAVTTAFRDATNAGLEYNETIEQSRLAIASLITAQADLIDSNGRQLQGVEALDAAYAASVDQVRKLRIAGIQTAATTKELVDAFQQAVGAGLATGLTLDEIRTVTIRIAQAAGALGVPYRQLNEEIRSILGGIIDQNTRIAKALGLKNEEIKLAKEQGRLAEFLLEKFEAFGVAGERIVETWAALKSNVQETFELFAGEATLPLFETVRTRGLGAVQRIFDFDTAEISKEFNAILRTLQQVFAGIGDQVAGTFEKALNAAVNLNYWLQANEEAVGEVVFQVGEVVRGIAEMVVGVNQFGLYLLKSSAQAGILAQIIETTADTFKTIGRSPILSLGAGLGATAGTFAIINAVLGSTAVIVAGVAAGLLVLAAAYDSANESAAELLQTEQKLAGLQEQEVTQRGKNAETALQLAQEYAKIRTSMREGTIQSDKLEDAQKRLRDITAELARLNPDYAHAISETEEAQGDYVAAVREVIQAEYDLLGVQQASNLRRRRELRARRRDLEEELRVLEQGPDTGWITLGEWIEETTGKRPFWREWYLDVAGSDLRNELAEINQLLDELGENNATITRVRENINKFLLGPDFEIRGRETGEEDTEARAAEIERTIAEIQARLAMKEARLKQQYEENIISYIEYYDRLTRAQQTAIRQQIALREEQLGLEDDPKKRSRVEVQILQLQTQAYQKYIENELARRNAQIKFASEASKVEQGLLDALGESAEATRLKLEEQYREYRADLMAMGREGLDDLARLDQFINFEVARESLDQYEEMVQRAQETTRSAITEIEQLRSLGVIGQTEAQERIATEYERLLSLMSRLLPLMREQAELLGDDESLQVIAEMESNMRQMDYTIQDLRDHWKEFREDIGTAAAQELSRYLTTAVTEADSLGDAFTNLVGSLEGIRNLLGQIAQQMVEIAARALALKIIQSIPGFSTVGAARGGFVNPGSIFGPVVRRASGGAITGPGTSTSDSILARLSSGEYVVRAASVRKYGTDFFHALNAGAMPKEIANLKRYATGGIVGGVPTTATKDFKGELTIGLSEGLVVEQLNTPAGERLMLKVISKNRRGVLRSLGI